MITPEKDRRLCRRRPPKRTVQVICKQGSLDLGPNLADSLIDYSEAGVRIVAKKALAIGLEVSVTLEGPGSSKPVKRLGKVEWVVPTDEGAFRVGVEFAKRLEYADMNNLT